MYPGHTKLMAGSKMRRNDEIIYTIPCYGT